MEMAHTASLPRWYWIVTSLALIWMLFGVFALVMDLMTNEAALEGLSEAERQLYAARPTWLFIVYGIAVLAGLGGVIGLLLRKTWAVAVLALSLIAVIIQFAYVLFIMGAIDVVGAAAALPFPLVIFTIGVLLLWLAMRARRLGWLD